jgi:predicted dehydrogenase
MTHTTRVGFIGTGPDPDRPDTTGYAMAYRHASGYERLDDCELVACADIVPENAAAFAEKHGIDDEHVYTDYREMLVECDLDVVSVCTPPGTHHELVLGAARSGQVGAIHCEKPLAKTLPDAREMVEVCEAEGVQLTVNHQYRYGKPFAKAKTLLDGGAIGELRRFEFGHTTLYDTGSHYFDLCNWYNHYADVEWVLAGLDYREENRMFGAHNENQGLAQWRYENGVFGLASTGWGDEFVDCLLRIRGSEGEIEIGSSSGDLRYRNAHTDGRWKVVDTDGDTVWGPTAGRVGAGLKRVLPRIADRLVARLEGPSFIDRAIEGVVTAYREGRTPELDARRALASQELAFAAWESVRRRGRVDLPLDVEDNPLEAMVEAGELDPAPAEDPETQRSPSS